MIFDSLSFHRKVNSIVSCILIISFFFRMSLKLNHFLSRSQSLKTSTHRLFSSSYVPTPIFNQELKTKHREFVYNKFKDTNYYEYLREESARKLVDRLEDINRSFPHALEIGNYRGQLLDIIDSAESLRGDKGGIGGVQTLVQTSTFPQSNSKTMNPDITRLGLVKPEQILCNDETLPFPDNSFDLVMSNLYLHWVNDLPKALKEIQRVLKPDGAFIASVLGGKTLEELSHSLYLGEMERRGHVRPHTSPLILASDVAGLVQSTPFALPTIDVETINVINKTIFKYKQ